MAGDRITTRGWRFELDGFDHTVEIEPRRILRPTGIFLDDHRVAQLPRLTWTIVGAPFRISSHRAVVECAIRVREDESEVVYRLVIDGISHGPPQPIDGRSNRPALAHQPRRSLRRRVVAIGIGAAVFGFGAGFNLPAGLSTGSTQAPTLALVVLGTGLASVAGIPIAAWRYIHDHRWGAVQDMFLAGALPFLAAFLVGWVLGSAAGVDVTELLAAVVMAPAFVLIGLVTIWYGLTLTVMKLRPRADYDAGRGLPSLLFAVGAVMLGLGILGFGVGALTAMLGIGGGTLHEAGPLAGPILLISVALVLLACVPILIGKPARVDPGPDFG